MWKKAEPQKPDVSSAPAPQVQPSPVSRSPVPQPRERAVIGPTIVIKGDLTGEEDLLIEGRVEGKIELRRHGVTVGKNGRIKADIYAKIINIEGTVEGNLYGEEQLVVRQSGSVHGNIVAPRVALEDGSNFKGSIDMTAREKASSPVIVQEKNSAGAKAP